MSEAGRRLHDSDLHDSDCERQPELSVFDGCHCGCRYDRGKVEARLIAVEREQRQHNDVCSEAQAKTTRERHEFEDRIEHLGEQLAAVERERDQYHQEWRANLVAYANLEARVAALDGALRRFGQHPETCAGGATGEPPTT